MPTGYTAAVKDGTVTEFRDFAIHCAKAFGAWMFQRDDGNVPTAMEPPEPSSYHKTALADAERQVHEYEARTDLEWQYACDADFNKLWEHYVSSTERRKTEKERYEAMLAQVVAWTPPTLEHEGMKTFMIEQLTESISFDCGYETKIPERMDWKKYRTERLEHAREEVTYHREQWDKENERYVKNKAFIDAFFASLPAMVEEIAGSIHTDEETEKDNRKRREREQKLIAAEARSDGED